MKAGAVFAKPLSEWFSGSSMEHLKAWAYRELVGRWPANFPPSEVYQDSDWERVVREKVGELMPGEIQGWQDEFGRIREVVAKFAFPGYQIDVEPLADHFYVQVHYLEPDVMSGVEEEQRGRKWVFPVGQTTGQLAQTCLKAILTSLEHRAREHFTYRGKPVLQPHFDLDKVWEILPEQEHDNVLFK